jgi:hypothetical protein
MVSSLPWLLGFASTASVDRTVAVPTPTRFRVVDVVPFEEDESPFVGLLQVDAPSTTRRSG